MNRRDFLKAAGSILYGIIQISTSKSSEMQVRNDSPKNTSAENQPKKIYLNVLEITEGLFSRDKAVRLEDYENDETSGFFRKEYIKDGKLEVKVVAGEDNLVMVKLPGRTLEAPGDKGYITVRENQLKYAA